MAKRRSIAYYEIVNVPDQEQFLIIYNHVIDGLYLLEKIFKKNNKIRKFDISEMWQYKYENSIAIFDSTKKARAISTILEMDFRVVFEYAHKNWVHNRKSHEGIFELFFCTGYNFSLQPNKNKANKKTNLIWHQRNYPCYAKTEIEEFLFE